jgi:hypothetical protein
LVLSPCQTRWELRCESLHDSCPVKREQELHESWRETTGYYQSNDSKSHQLSSKFEPAQSWELEGQLCLGGALIKGFDWNKWCFRLNEKLGKMLLFCAQQWGTIIRNVQMESNIGHVHVHLLQLRRKILRMAPRPSLLCRHCSSYFFLFFVP